MSKLLTDPDIRKLVAVLVVCLIIAVAMVYLDRPDYRGHNRVLLCGFFNGSIYQRGCVVFFNDTLNDSVLLQGYLSGKTSSIM